MQKISRLAFLSNASLAGIAVAGASPLQAIDRVAALHPGTFPEIDAALSHALRHQHESWAERTCGGKHRLDRPAELLLLARCRE